MEESKVIELLRNDDEYYNGVGRDYFSNSNIQDILNGTYDKDKVWPWKPHFEFGRYVHVSILEPHKVGQFKVYDGTRREKAYKALGEDMMTSSEQRKAQLCIDAINASREGRGLLYGHGVEYEVPAITEIDGVGWKGKADALNHDLKLIVDIKTTSDLTGFQSKAYQFGYTSQAWLYWKLFGYPVVFVVVCKKTYDVAIVEFQRNFYQAGKDRVYEAIELIKQNNY